MPPGAKKRKAARRRRKEEEEASSGVQTNGPPGTSPQGSGSESGGEMASVVNPNGREDAPEEEKAGSFEPGNGAASARSLQEEKGEGGKGNSEEGASVEQAGDGKDDDRCNVGGDEIDSGPSGELRKSVDAADLSCVVEEEKPSEVPIERMGEFSTVEVKAAVEQARKVEGSSSAELEEEVLGLSDQQAPECTASREPVDSADLPLQVVQRTSWIGCCGLFDALVGSRK